VLSGTRPPFFLTENCAAGDTIEFTFQLPGYVKNGTDAQHSATQSTYEAPCTPKEGGFDTGLQTTTMTGGKSFTLLVRTIFSSTLVFYLNVTLRSMIPNPYGTSEPARADLFAGD